MFINYELAFGDSVLPELIKKYSRVSNRDSQRLLELEWGERAFSRVSGRLINISKLVE
jgi:hypothetical protein